MVACDARRSIRLQRISTNAGRVPVDHPLTEQFDFLKNRLLGRDDAGKIHHFGEPQHARMRKERAHVFGVKVCAGGFKRCCGYAGWKHVVDVADGLLRRVQHKPHSLYAADVDDLVRVGDQGRRARWQHRAGKFRGYRHRAFNVAMCVDQAGAYRDAFAVDLVVRAVMADAGNQAVCNRDVRPDDLPGENVEYVGVFQHEIGHAAAGGRFDQ